MGIKRFARSFYIVYKVPLDLRNVNIWTFVVTANL